ncbi:hypothetical protein [Streptomyces sp. NBC_01763]|uniref:hypothetical protein n=1 Tax=Streptomyces sp. NBC_01763 TaxID=2975934 RepID=UPI002DDC562C|nr:hypothetical protein [Streptomyces sp. NBC_01763]WSC41476.1 hypothetical protein OHA08_41895 [Streptomyces sp. NBC_01763]
MGEYGALWERCARRGSGQEGGGVRSAVVGEGGEQAEEVPVGGPFERHSAGAIGFHLIGERVPPPVRLVEAIVLPDDGPVHLSIQQSQGVDRDTESAHGSVLNTGGFDDSAHSPTAMAEHVATRKP